MIGRKKTKILNVSWRGRWACQVLYGRAAFLSKTTDKEQVRTKSAQVKKQCPKDEMRLGNRSTRLQTPRWNKVFLESEHDYKVPFEFFNLAK